MADDRRGAHHAALLANRILATALEACRRQHLVVEGDNWYSCPKSGACSDDSRKSECDCGAEEFNQRIDIALAQSARICRRYSARPVT